MPLTFVHLSDIHFGQEDGGKIIVNNDVKERLIEDVTDQLKKYFGGIVEGVIVTGDVAYGGKKEEYAAAGKWLDRLTASIGCKRTAVQVVPGNHDIDRDEITEIGRMLLQSIVDGGEQKLDLFLKTELDRQSLYARFAHYVPFSQGYNCPLDGSGGRAGERTYSLAPGRSLKIIGMNSALICAHKDTEGGLLLGARQRVLPRTPGEELVVLCHHPLNWLQDSADARNYIKARARVFMSGHEHNPSVDVKPTEDGCDLMMLAAGATVPPKIENGVNYTYNLLSFDWDATTDGLRVAIIPRAWGDGKKDFEDDNQQLQGHARTSVLRCGQFRKAPIATLLARQGEEAATAKISEPEPVTGGQQPSPEDVAVSPDYEIVMLRFFRDLSSAQRLQILLSLGALPDEWPPQLTDIVERRAFDKLASQNRLQELKAAIKTLDK